MSDKKEEEAKNQQIQDDMQALRIRADGNDTRIVSLTRWIAIGSVGVVVFEALKWYYGY